MESKLNYCITNHRITKMKKKIKNLTAELFSIGSQNTQRVFVRITGTLVICFLLGSVVNAQKKDGISRYETFVYTSDMTNVYHNSWGTGDYNVEVSIKQMCGVTDTYRNNWKANWKQRQIAANNDNLVQRSWSTFTSQRWDEITQRWVITTLKAPAGMINADLLNELHLNTR